MNRQAAFLRPATLILLAAAFAGLIWANYQFTSQHQGGNDFAIYWSSARTVLMDNATPYGELASSRGQSLIYGIAGSPGLPPSLLDLPFHVAGIVIPFSLIQDFPFARALWMSLLEIALVITVFISFRIFRWAPNPVTGAMIIFFSIFSVYGLWALILGNAIILAGLLISGALLALKENQDDLAGVLLALATFKFMSIGLLLVYILIWAASQRRKRVFFPFIMTLVILVALSFFFFPNWFISYFRAIYANLTFGGWMSPSIIIQGSLPYIGDKLGWLLSGSLALILLIEWWLSIKKEFHMMAWTSALTLAFTPFIGFPTFPQNYVILIFSLIMGLSVISKRWPSSSNYIIAGLLLFLFIGSWAVAVFMTDRIQALYFSYPASIIFLLYWIRWWAISHTREQPEPISSL